MMICGIYDTKIEKYRSFYFIDELEDFKRSLTKLVNTPGNQFYDFSEDFIFYDLGLIDVDIGNISHKVPQALFSLSSLKVKTEVSADEK